MSETSHPLTPAKQTATDTGGKALPEGTRPVGPAMLLTLALLAAVAPFGIDLYLSAFPAMTVDLATTATGVQLSLTAFLVGAGVGQVIFGPWSDRAGRMAPLLTGLSLFLAASIVAVIANSIGMLVFARLVQGLGGAAGMVIGRAMILDRDEGRQARQMPSDPRSRGVPGAGRTWRRALPVTKQAGADGGDSPPQQQCHGVVRVNVAEPQEVHDCLGRFARLLFPDEAREDTFDCAPVADTARELLQDHGEGQRTEGAVLGNADHERRGQFEKQIDQFGEHRDLLVEAGLVIRNGQWAVPSVQQLASDRRGRRLVGDAASPQHAVQAPLRVDLGLQM